MEEAQLAIRHETDSQSIAIPARALAQKAYAACRAGCFRPGVRHETDDMAETAQPQAVLQILSVADVQAALAHECIPPIHGTNAGQTCDGIHDVQYRSPPPGCRPVFDPFKYVP